MQAIRPLFVIGILALTVFSGCLAAEEPKSTSGTPSPTTSAATTSPSGTTTPPSGGAEPAAPVANVTVNMTNGTAPLLISIAITDDSGEDQENVTWTVEFGDGNETNGTALPGRTNYTYASEGTFELLLTLTTDGGESTDSEMITVEAGAPSGPPSETVFESGPVAGYVSEGGYDSCPAYLAGPGNEDGLGLWIELEPGHVGMTFTTSETTGGDSDGWLFAEADGEPLSADINNGGGEATGVIPAEAKWLLIVSWGTPSANMVVTFTPTA
jgi:hypothetical protein